MRLRVRQGCVGFVLILFAACQSSLKRPVEERVMVTRTQIHMGTLVSVQLPTVADPDLTELSFAKVRELDEKLSHYKKDSFISRLNQRERIQVPPDVMEFLMMGLNMERETNGYFNMAWSAKSPLKNVLQVEPDGHVHLRRGAQIDPGGIGKGFAVDRVFELWRDRQLTQGLLALSGDIRCLHPCEIYIQNPEEKNEVFMKLNLSQRDIGVSTSGHYENPGHIKDPQTHASPQHFLSVTLVSEGSSARLDAMTTAVFNMPIDDAIKWLKNRKLAYFLLTQDYRLLYSLGPQVGWIQTFSLVEGSLKNKIKMVQM